MQSQWRFDPRTLLQRYWAKQQQQNFIKGSQEILKFCDLTPNTITSPSSLIVSRTCDKWQRHCCNIHSRPSTLDAAYNFHSPWLYSTRSSISKQPLFAPKGTRWSLPTSNSQKVPVSSRPVWEERTLWAESPQQRSFLPWGRLRNFSFLCLPPLTQGPHQQSRSIPC